MPVSVPPVPMPLQKPWIGLATWAMISSAVCFLWARVLLGFSNCWGTNTLGFFAFIRSAQFRHSSMHLPMSPASWISLTSAP